MHTAENTRRTSQKVFASPIRVTKVPQLPSSGNRCACRCEGGRNTAVTFYGTRTFGGLNGYVSGILISSWNLPPRKPKHNTFQDDWRGYQSVVAGIVARAARAQYLHTACREDRRSPPSAPWSSRPPDLLLSGFYSSVDTWEGSVIPLFTEPAAPCLCRRPRTFTQTHVKDKLWR